MTVTEKPAKPVRSINWTEILKNAGIPEPAWDKKLDLPTVRITARAEEHRENWMHI